MSAASDRCANKVDRLQRILREHEIGFVVLDSVGMACDGPPEEAQAALGFFDALRAFEVGALCVAHAKSQRRHRPTIRQHLLAQQRAINLVRQEATGGSSLHADCWPLQPQVKHRAAGKPNRLQAGVDTDSTSIERTDVRDVPELAGQVPLRTRISRELEQHALSAPELAERLSAPIDSVRKALDRGQASSSPAYQGIVDGIIRFGLAAPAREGIS